MAQRPCPLYLPFTVGRGRAFKPTQKGRLMSPGRVFWSTKGNPRISCMGELSPSRRDFPATIGREGVPAAFPLVSRGRASHDTEAPRLGETGRSSVELESRSRVAGHGHRLTRLVGVLPATHNHVQRTSNRRLGQRAPVLSLWRGRAENGRTSVNSARSKAIINLSLG